MKLVVVSLLAALVAAPLAAQAAQAPARYSMSLNGKVTASYTYANSTSSEECVASRLGWERRELVFRSVRPTRIEVLRVRNRADYRPPAVARVRESGTIGGRRWSETRRCRGAPIERTNGTCAPVTQRERLLRLRFRWAGANRIWFRPPASQGPAVKLCGLDRAVPFRGWLDLAIGRVDEDALLAGRSLRVIARGEVTRSSTVVSEQDLSVGEELNVRWTLTFRRIR